MAYTTDSCLAWEAWNGVSTTTSVTDEAIWLSWAGSTARSTTATIVTTTTTDSAWTYWVDESFAVRPRAIETAEQITTRENERKQRLELERARKARARRLLMDVLDARQRKDLEKHNYFYVVGGNTGNKYRIDHGRAGNVKLIIKGKVKQSFCAHPAIYCPNEDTMLAQKVMLEHMENQFRSTANVTYH